MPVYAHAQRNEGRRANGDKDIRAKSGAALAPLALGADQGREDEGEEDPDGEVEELSGVKLLNVKPRKDQVRQADRWDRELEMWRMPPLSRLRPMTLSRSTKIWMLVLRGYLCLGGRSRARQDSHFGILMRLCGKRRSTRNRQDARGAHLPFAQSTRPKGHPLLDWWSAQADVCDGRQGAATLGARRQQSVVIDLRAEANIRVRGANGNPCGRLIPNSTRRRFDIR